MHVQRTCGAIASFTTPYMELRYPCPSFAVAGSFTAPWCLLRVHIVYAVNQLSSWSCHMISKQRETYNVYRTQLLPLVDLLVVPAQKPFGVISF